MNYFEFYGIKRSFYLDEDHLKNCFYEKSRKYHPDFFTQSSTDSQTEALTKSSLNNNAYKVLVDFDTRIKYILELEGALTEENKNEIPQMFLMEMMDFNEKVMELQFEFDSDKYTSVSKELEGLEKQLLAEVEPSMKAYDQGSQESLNQVKEYYLKKRYLARLEENLANLSS